jgi:hypothetical protein
MPQILDQSAAPAPLNEAARTPASAIGTACILRKAVRGAAVASHHGQRAIDRSSMPTEIGSDC